MNLYDRICTEAGRDQIEKIIRKFYERAFSDGIIGHFFFGHDHELLVARQTAFAIALLGGPSEYRGKPLATAHSSLGIRNAHFGRRQVLMREVLEEFQISAGIIDEWLEREERLRPLVVSGATPPPCK
jgi:truncated hemoglobin YjbI